MILTDIEEPKNPVRLQRLLFCGMSRATVRLDLILDRAMQLFRDFSSGHHE